MAYTLRQIVTAFSIIYLIVLTALGSYALNAVRTYSLPIPTALTAFTLALPALAGVSLETISTLVRPQSRRNKQIQLSPQWLHLVVIVLTIYETVVATLSAAHIGPIACSLDEEWGWLFSRKDAYRIRTIQDAFDCCGLHSVLDRAWPFPANGVKADACVTSFGREKSCFGDWRALEQKTAIMMMLVPILVFVWQMFMLSLPQTRESWLREAAHLPLPVPDAEGGQRVIEYPYTDDPIVETNDDPNGYPQNSRRVKRARESASKSLTALEQALDSRVQPSQIHENEWEDERRDTEREREANGT